MAQIRLKYGRVGVGINDKPGDIIDVSPSLAERMIANGTAERVAPPERETAMVDSGAPRRARGRRRAKQVETR